MTNNSFDKEMARILRDMKIPYDAASWNRLEKKLNEHDKEDAIFDQVIADKLKSLSVPLTSNSFDKLEAKLDKSTAKGPNGFRLFAGIAAVILLIFGYFYIENDTSKDIVETKTVKSIKVRGKSGQIVSAKTEADVYKENTTIVSATAIDGISTKDLNQIMNIAHKRNQNTQFITKPNSNYIGDVIVSNTSGYSLKPNYGMKLIGNNPHQSPFVLSQIGYSDLIPNSFTMGYTIEFGEQFFPINIEPQSYPENNSIDIPNKEKVESNSFRPDNSVAMSKRRRGNQNSLAYESAESGFMEKETYDMDLVKKVDGKQVSNGFFAKLYVSPTINLIQTPNDIELNTPGYSQVKTGFGGGVALSYKKNKHEIESGINVAGLRYSPKKIVQGNESSSLYLDKMKYLQIKIPLVHKYHFVENSKWDMYSVAGVSANAVYNADYVFVETKIDDTGKKHTLEKFAKELRDDYVFQNSVYGEKNYPKGVQDGTKIKDKLFVSANVGVGIKRKFNNGLSIYIEPQYNYTFNEFGPNKDLLSCGEFRLGVSKALSL